jgi:uncharacterized protein (DUF1501 family)
MATFSPTRRDWLRLVSAGMLGGSISGWLAPLATAVAGQPQRKRACILLWMSGGPSQTDTFDLKPGHANGGPFKEISTKVPGIRISEHLPKIAQWTDRMALIRSMNTKEGDHSRATQVMHTGQMPQGSVDYPALGALLAKELADSEAALPSFVSIAPERGIVPAAYSAGFLGPRYAPLMVAEPRQGMRNIDQALRVADLQAAAGIRSQETDARFKLLLEMDKEFTTARPSTPTQSHLTTYERAMRLMRSPAAKAFQLEEEPAALRDAYGRNLFGQGCLLARRLVEQGVPFVEVSLNGVAGQGLGWDTHSNNFEAVKQLSQVLDPAWATLMTDLKQRGLLDSTLIVWMGEFGRTPRINGDRGRDHFPNAWSVVLAGGGLQGGSVVGRTSASGMAVEERPVNVTDLLATICLALGVDPNKQNETPAGRPIRIVDKSAKPLKEILA